jgi:hypothetical protein
VHTAQHYAAPVHYNAVGMLAKNSDALHDDIREALATSETKLIVVLVLAFHNNSGWVSVCVWIDMEMVMGGVWARGCRYGREFGW